MLLENAKRTFERLTGIGRPKPRHLKGLVREGKALTHCFKDDGETPNNPHFPLVLYRGALLLGHGYDPAAVIEEIFASHGWGDSWRDGVYDFLHFHSHTHEVLGIARGSAKVQFGGAKGKVLSVKAGDVVVLPAGTGHKRISATKDLLVVGAYPASGKYDEPKPDDVDIEKARRAIAKVRPPESDPVYGRKGPVVELWKA
jgi:uncharacterized protein YjlB